MNRMLRVVEVAWIIVAVISGLEIIKLWGSGKVEFWYFVAGFVIGIFMFFFRRKQRIRMEKYNRQKENETENT